MSKTHIHRILYASLLKRGISNIYILKSSYMCDDIKATLNVLEEVGCIIKYNENTRCLLIDSQNISYQGNIIYCNASATTLRMAIIILVYLFENVKLSGTKKLMLRPQDFYENLFKNTNISFTLNNNVLEVSGNLKEVFLKNPKKLKIINCNSSQFITALMYIIPFYKEEYILEFKGVMESVSYLEITSSILENYNINYEFSYENKVLKTIAYNKNFSNNKLETVYENKVINKKQLFQNKKEIIPEVDYSSYAFWIVANEMGANIKFLGHIKQYNLEKVHPDQYIQEIIRKNLEVIDIKDCPDLLPILLVFACFRNQNINKTKIINYHRNRLKEANRVEDMTIQLNKLGANIRVYKNYIEIKRIEYLLGGEINTYEDHRIAMAFAISSLKVKGVLKINNSKVVSKSYFDFWKDFKSLGGRCE